MPSALEFVAALEEKQHTLAELVLQHDAELKALLDQIGKLSPAIGEEVSQRLKQAVPDLVQSACNEYSLDVETRCKTALAEAETRLEGIRAQIVNLARDKFTEAEKSLGLSVADVERRLGDSLKSIAGEHAAEIERGLLARIASELSARTEKVELEQRIQLIDWFRGEFKPGTEAKRGEVWTFVGSTFLALDDTDELPTRRNVGGKSPRWALLAARGSGGGGGSGSGGDSLPSQAGNAGKYLTTDGSVASWAALAGGGDLLAANNLSDLSNAATARTNLGLKGAAVLDVGTTAGTVAAGNHDHSSNKLAQANTHESPDTDTATTALHHTLGTGANQAAAGNHTHSDATSSVAGFMPATDKTKLDTIQAAEADVTSATTTDIGAASSDNVRITGTTTITGLGTVAAGTRRYVRFADALTLTHNGTSLILPGGANITTAANDRMTAVSLGSGNWLVRDYDKADGTAVVASAGGTKTYARFTPSNNYPPSSNYATLDTRNSILVLDFDDGATNEESVFVGMVPEAASLGSGLKVRIYWMATSATSGNCRWGVQFADLSDQDIDGLTFDTAAEAHTAASGTSGIAVVTEITITDIDDIVAGVPFALKVYRDSSDTTNDTMTGDAELVAVEIRSAA